ncbi:MAG TPA: carboxy terminal-processing peptidase [Flavilitoribacter sp.]|nr:carboxy terminal-processing peptidase [Flavilitoribacter sp.]
MLKARGTVFFSVLAAAALLMAAYFPKENNEEKEAVLVRTIMRGLEYMHYQPPTIDDDFSHKAFDLYLDDIDSGRRFLTQGDVNKMKVFRNLIDDEATTGDLAFFDLSMDLLNEGLKKTQGYYREILASSFDFTKKEGFETDGKKRGFAKNDEDLREYWRQYLKYETLTRYADKLEAQGKKGEEAEKKSPEELEQAARKEVLDMLDKWYEALFKFKREERLSIYLNTLTSIYDPHTNYYRPIDKETFNIRFSGRLEGIGAQLTSEGEFTKVANIVVGGPAWRGKELEEGDFILKVAQGSNDPIDIKGWDLDDVVQQIRGNKGTEVKLTVKKKVDGSVKDISIIRDIVIIEDNFAKSLILDGASEGEKVGYIYLPSFYADFEHSDGRFCAADVEQEINKLKDAKVNGIILDLRNNGGGSLIDVVKMSGFFIEDGPIVQVKSRGQKPEVMMDTDSKVQYDGPLIVLVNYNSASASEILAAALQDYGRAVIVGSNSTYGKGTVQRFIDLDRTIRGFDNYKPLGELKLTVQKFYRINGGSTQLRGVTPDIVLPDSYYFIPTGEKETENAMAWSEINPVDYNQRVLKLDHLDQLKQRSEARVKQSETFQKVTENARRLKRQSDETSYPLDMNTFMSLEKQQKSEAEAYKDLFKNVVNKGVTNLEVDLPSIHADESKEARNESFVTSVSKDIYIRETLNIMHDLLNLEKH